MTSSGEMGPPHPHASFSPPSQFETILLALSGSVAAGSVEGAGRAIRNPFLYDSRLDALSLVLRAIGVAATFGIPDGIPVALLIRQGWGASAAALWPPRWVALARRFFSRLKRRVGEAPGARIGITAGALVATLCAGYIDRVGAKH